MNKVARIGAVFSLTLGLLVTGGCGKKSQPGGEPGTRNEFTLRGPTGATSIKPGESQTVTISMDRGKDFKDAVNLKAESPKGIEADLTPAVLNASDKGDVQMKITAHRDAAAGDNMVRLLATPAAGKATTLDVKVKVTPLQESFTLKGPLLETSIKQGDTQTINFSVNRDNDFKQAIKFTADAPKDTKVEVTPAEVQPSDKSQLNLRIMVDPKAAVGEHVIHVTGTPASGQPVVTDVKFRVKEPG